MLALCVGALKHREISWGGWPSGGHMCCTSIPMARRLSLGASWWKGAVEASSTLGGAEGQCSPGMTRRKDPMMVTVTLSPLHLRTSAYLPHMLTL